MWLENVLYVWKNSDKVACYLVCPVATAIISNASKNGYVMEVAGVIIVALSVVGLHTSRSLQFLVEGACTPRLKPFKGGFTACRVLCDLTHNNNFCG